MIKAPHWQLRSHLKYIRTDGKKKSYDARFPVLMYLIMACNNNLRCYVGIDRLCQDTGLSNKPIGEALSWLESHGAIFNVPSEHRVGKERQLHSNKKVWQLTTVLKVKDMVIDYLYVGEASSQMFDDLFSTIKSIAPDKLLPILDKQISVQETCKNDEIHVQDTSKNKQISVQSTSKSTEIHVQNTHTSKKIDVQSTCNLGEIDVQDTCKNEKIHVQSTRKGINKNIQVINKKEKDINNLLRYARPRAFSLLLKNVKLKLQQKQLVTESTSPREDELYSEQIIDFSNKPYTEAEYKWFVESGRCTEKKLSESVYRPVWHNFTKVRENDGKIIPFVLNTIWDDRESLLRCQIRQDTNTWDMTVELVKHFWGVESGHAKRMATMLLGTAKSGEWKKYKLEQPMQPDELYAFGCWIFDMRCVEHPYKPRSAEDIAEFAQEFRELWNHFEHVNYASYKIRDVFDEPFKQPEPDYDDYTPPPEQQAEFYRRMEAELGFSLTGDF